MCDVCDVLLLYRYYTLIYKYIYKYTSIKYNVYVYKRTHAVKELMGTKRIKRRIRRRRRRRERCDEMRCVCIGVSA